MKKLILLFAAILLASTGLLADEFPMVVDKIKYQFNDETYIAKVIGYDTSTPEYIQIPEKITYKNKEYLVTSIGEEAFTNCSSLTQIEIPDCVTTIEKYAFVRCSALKEITIPAAVTSIGANAFGDCTGLTNVTFKGSLCEANIDGSAFMNVGSTSTIVNLFLPDSWSNSYLPESSSTPWHGGLFFSNRRFNLNEYKTEIIVEIETEAAQITDLLAKETTTINDYKESITNAKNRIEVDNIKYDSDKYISLHKNRKAALAAIADALGEYSGSEVVYALLATEIDAIYAAQNATTITNNQNAAIAKLPTVIAIYQSIYNEAEAKILGAMAEECDDCHAIEVKKDDTTITLYAPEEVKFIKTEATKN